MLAKALLLEGVEVGEVQDLGEFVERVDARLSEGWVEEVGLGDLVWVGSGDEIGEFGEEVIGHDDALVDGGEFVVA